MIHCTDDDDDDEDDWWVAPLAESETGDLADAGGDEGAGAPPGACTEEPPETGATSPQLDPRTNQGSTSHS